MPMPMPMHYNNHVDLFIARNLAFHERTKHIKIECHFIHDKVLMGVIATPHVSSSDWLAIIMTKSISICLMIAKDPSWTCLIYIV